MLTKAFMVVTLLKQSKIQITIFILGAFVACALAILTSGHADAACSVDTSRGVVTQQFTVPADQVGTYRVWARMAAGTAADKDSFYLEIDGGECITFGNTGLSASGWKWVDYRDGNANTKVNTASLSAGNHTVRMIGLEDAVKVDKLLFVRSTSCVPTDMAGNPCLPDTIPPNNVTVSAPASPLSGVKQLTATASDNDAIASVAFWLGNTPLQPADSTSPYTYDLDTTQLTNGPYKLTAVARDAAGNETKSAEVNITINNPVPDTTKPTVSITSPASSASIPAGVVTVNATATDNVGVTKVEFFVGNSTTPIVTDTSSPYSSGTSITLAAGSHTIKVVGYDAAGNKGEASVTITVTSTTPPPKACDFNNDNQVETADLAFIIGNNWKKTVTVNTNGDCNGPNGTPDGIVGIEDLGKLLALWRR